MSWIVRAAHRPSMLAPSRKHYKPREKLGCMSTNGSMAGLCLPYDAVRLQGNVDVGMKRNNAYRVI